MSAFVYMIECETCLNRGLLYKGNSLFKQGRIEIEVPFGDSNGPIQTVHQRNLYSNKLIQRTYSKVIPIQMGLVQIALEREIHFK